jgi:hypothetical protein
LRRQHAGGVPRTSTFALNNATLPSALALANKGWKRALTDDPYLRAGLNVALGQVTCRPVAEALGYKFVDPMAVINRVPQAATKALAPSGERREATLGGSGRRAAPRHSPLGERQRSTLGEHTKSRSNQDAGQSQQLGARQHHPHHRQYAQRNQYRCASKILGALDSRCVSSPMRSIAASTLELRS